MCNLRLLRGGQRDARRMVDELGLDAMAFAQLLDAIVQRVDQAARVGGTRNSLMIARRLSALRRPRCAVAQVALHARIVARAPPLPSAEGAS
jgi:hypothetical protein